jgi:ubiquinone biosynthesis protein UbiJ
MPGFPKWTITTCQQVSWRCIKAGKPDVLKPLLTRLLNHLVNQNSWAREQLQPFAGRAVRFNLPPVSTTITILEDGGLAASGEAAQPEATITIPFSAALRLLADDDKANSLITLEGDAELAAVFSRVLRNMQWDYEEDLSKLVGDIPAHQAMEFGRKTVSGIKRQTLNVAQMFSEYWQEEQPIIAKKRHVENFIKDVDALRDDAERLEKRVAKFESMLPGVMEKTTTTEPPEEHLKEKPAS